MRPTCCCHCLHLSSLSAFGGDYKDVQPIVKAPTEVAMWLWSRSGRGTLVFRHTVPRACHRSKVLDVLPTWCLAASRCPASCLAQDLRAVQLGSSPPRGLRRWLCGWGGTGSRKLVNALYDTQA